MSYSRTVFSLSISDAYHTWFPRTTIYVHSDIFYVRFYIPLAVICVHQRGSLMSITCTQTCYVLWQCYDNVYTFSRINICAKTRLEDYYYTLYHLMTKSSGNLFCLQQIRFVTPCHHTFPYILIYKQTLAVIPEKCFDFFQVFCTWKSWKPCHSRLFVFVIPGVENAGRRPIPLPFIFFRKTS